MHQKCVAIVIVTLLLLLNSSIQLSNSFKDDPIIDCKPRYISIQVYGEMGDPNWIFVKGQRGNDKCRFRNTSNATIAIRECNVERIRSSNPRGIFFNVVVITQMHPFFITVMDKAYEISCFYQETDRDVSAPLDVSMITSQRIVSSMKLPQCTYTLREKSADGPQIRYSKLGGLVWHVWTCPSDYAMLVHSCFVKDLTDSEKVEVIDNTGCSLDEDLILTPKYTLDRNTAAVANRAFKFADTTDIRFHCKIRLCDRQKISCALLTPPRCKKTSADIKEGSTEEEEGSAEDAIISDDEDVQDHNGSLQSNRVKRDNTQESIDVSQQITVFYQENDRIPRNSPSNFGALQDNDNSICLSVVGFTLTLTALCVMMLMGSSFILLFFIRLHASKIHPEPLKCLKSNQKNAEYVFDNPT